MRDPEEAEGVSPGVVRGKDVDEGSVEDEEEPCQTCHRPEDPVVEFRQHVRPANWRIGSGPVKYSQIE